MSEAMNTADLGQLLDVSFGENGLGQITCLKTTKGFFVVNGYVYTAPRNVPVTLVFKGKKDAVARIEFGGLVIEFAIARPDEVKALLLELGK